MKNTIRFLLGALSGLLLSVGLAQAASHLDPMSSNSSATNVDSQYLASGNECDIAE